VIQKRLIVTNRLGLHARAAARLVHLAARFKSNVSLQRVDGGATADAKSILNVLMLAATSGTELSASAEGIDEAEALAALSELFSNGFGETEK
jgi:phosphocarrier protein